MKYLKVHLYIVFSVLLISSCSDPQEKRPDVEKGFLDLSSWDFEKDGLVNLNGQWEFYWEQLLESGDPELNDSIRAEYISVPGGWASKSSEGIEYPEFGFATYRLKIKVPDKDSDYSFIFMSIFTSASLWVNGTFIFE